MQVLSGENPSPAGPVAQSQNYRETDVKQVNMSGPPFWMSEWVNGRVNELVNESMTESMSKWVMS